MKSNRCYCTPQRDSLPRWYRWVILASTCVAQLIGIGYMTAATSMYPIYYDDRFGDRKIAGQIGTIGLSLSFLACLPAHYLTLTITERWVQVIGGTLMVVGEFMSGLATQAWVALIGTGILTGTGTAFIMIATYSIVGKYFPGKQLQPFAANVLFFNIGVMIFPFVIGKAIVELGYRDCKLLFAGVIALNIICGLMYVPTSAEQNHESANQGPKMSIKIPGSRSGVFDVNLMSTKFVSESKANKIVETDECTLADSRLPSSIESTVIPVSPNEGTTYRMNMLMKRQSSLSLLLSSLQEEKVETNTATKSGKARTLVASSHGTSIAELVTEQDLSAKKIIRKFLKTPKILAFLGSLFIFSASIVGFNSLIGDFARYKLGMSDETISLALSAQGLVMLFSGIIYLAVTWSCRFSSSMLHVTTVIISTILWLCLLVEGIDDVYYIAVMSIFGVSRSLFISNLYLTCLELSSPSTVMTLFMLDNVLEGIGGLSSPYLVLYLQVEVTLWAGVVAVCLMNALGVCIFLPFAIKEITESKRYTNKDEEVHAINFVALEQPIESSELDYNI